MSRQAKPKKPHTRRCWVGVVLAALFLAAVMALNMVLPAYAGLIDNFIGAPKANIPAADIAAAVASADALAAQIEAEGTVLLQNKGDTLPLSKEIRQVNVFGWASTAWLGGGSGSGGVSSVDVDFLRALEDYGIAYNTELTDMYRDFQDGREYTATLNSYPEQSCRLYEPDIGDTAYYSVQLLRDAKAYSDTAVVVFGRLSGESNDATKTQYKRVTKAGEIVTDESRTYLDLSSEEEALLAYVGENYENVIVLLNTGNVMAVGAVETTPGVDACLAVGLSGQNAASVLPAVLWGETEPSGRTADTWAYDLTTAASYANAGREGVGAYTGADGLYPADGTMNGNLGSAAPYTQVSYVDYSESIYIGYMWYETADAEGYWDTVNNAHGTGYAGVVQYPFGYGLSYTDFAWEIVRAPVGKNLRGDDTVEVTVRVSNTGDTAGRDVVELYYAAPYTPGEIEKAAVRLGAFAKTDVIAPGASEEVTLRLSAEDMASYDGYDANRNGFAGYELDAGSYTFRVCRDAHTPDESENAVFTMELAENVQYPTDSATGAPVSNQFTGAAAADGVSIDGSDSGQNIAFMTRADFAGTFPADHAASRPMAENVAALNLFDAAQAAAYEDADAQPITTGAKNGLAIEDRNGTTELGYRLGGDFDDPQWDALLDQMSTAEMENLFINAYGGTAEVKSIGKLRSRDADGPSQIGGFTGMGAGTGFPSASTLAQTWNTALSQEMGRIIGQQALQNGYSGWYAPAVNIHRSPFNGRNYEYYAEDSMLSGEMCGNAVLGAAQAGVYTYVKHFVCNDGESGIYRDAVYVWMTEQTLREIYLRPFQMIVERYGAAGLMTSYNRIGAVWAGGSKALLTDVLRGEWGFHGAVITDYCDHHAYMNGDQALRAGGSLWMSGVSGGRMAQETTSNSYYQALRRAAKDTLYMYLHVRVVNRDYSAAAGNEKMLRPVFHATIFGWRSLVGIIDVFAVGLFVLAVRRLAADRRQRGRKPQK